MSRWVVHARAAFDAHHALTAYKGEMEAPHLHDWQVEVRIGADVLGPEGYALDFHEVRQILAEALAPLHDSNLNTDPEIGRSSPTAERVAEAAMMGASGRRECGRASIPGWYGMGLFQRP